MGSSRCALDASQKELFTQKRFCDIISNVTNTGHDYILARVICKETAGSRGTSKHYCYDGKQLCKYIFEMLITGEGHKIRIKNYTDPTSQDAIAEINFFKLKHDSQTPLKAEYIGNQNSFLESNIFRTKVFGPEDPLDALSINFEPNVFKKSQLIKKKRAFTLAIFMFLFIVIFVLGYFLIAHSKTKNSLGSIRPILSMQKTI